MIELPTKQLSDYALTVNRLEPHECTYRVIISFTNNILSVTFGALERAILSLVAVNPLCDTICLY